jgi:hypothetical protein
MMRLIVFIMGFVALSLNSFGLNPNPTSSVDMAIANVMNAQKIPDESTVSVEENL